MDKVARDKVVADVVADMWRVVMLKDVDGWSPEMGAIASRIRCWRAKLASIGGRPWWLEYDAPEWRPAALSIEAWKYWKNASVPGGLVEIRVVNGSNLAEQCAVFEAEINRWITDNVALDGSERV